MTNYMTVTATEVYGLNIYASYPAAPPSERHPRRCLFVNNGGALNGTTAYAAFLDANDPGASSVSIGNGSLGMGNNKFTTSGTWNGTYPSRAVRSGPTTTASSIRKDVGLKAIDDGGTNRPPLFFVFSSSGPGASRPREKAASLR